MDTVSLKANGNAFEIVKSAKMLGVIVRNDLKWNDLVDNMDVYRFLGNRVRFFFSSICYRVRIRESGSELIFESDEKKSDTISQKPVNIQ